ncbi:helix-turn-helix domain-containing protein [Ornithobacterium rhinotracheale]
MAYTEKESKKVDNNKIQYEFEKNIQQLKKAQEKNEMTSYLLAKKTGVAESTVMRFYNEDGNPTFRNVLKFCEALGLELVIKKK